MSASVKDEGSEAVTVSNSPLSCRAVFLVLLGLRGGQTDNEVIALKAAVCDDERLLVEVIAFQHFDQRPDFIFLRFRLDNRICKGTGAEVIQRRNMELVDTFGNTVILNE